MSQFSLKVDADPRLWDTKAGRMMGKSKQAQEINQAINRTQLIIHTHYKELSDIDSENRRAYTCLIYPRLLSKLGLFM